MSDLSLVAIGTIFSDFRTTFISKSLENSAPVLNKKGRPIFRKGNLCGVTKIRYQSGQIKALRMWQSESVNSKGVCEHISDYIEHHPAPYLLNMSYLSNAIYFNGEYFSALLMDWCDGRNLKEFINIHINDIKVLISLKDSLLDMFKDMNQRGISHGDIHHNNICVSEVGAPILIDYDSMFVPSLKGFEDCCLGYSGFQLPNARENNKYLSHKADYFSQLIIILTIECIIQDKSLWTRYLDDDDTVSLLFKKDDFLNLRSSKIYSDIKNLKGEVPSLLNVLEQYLQKQNIDELWPFYESNEDNQSLFCINCGHEVFESIDKYCTKCGSLIYV